VERLWRVSDCEELVGVTFRGLWGWFLEVIHSHVSHEVFLRGKRYLKINLHFSRKI